MDTVVVAVVPGAAVRPAGIAEAAGKFGLSPVYVAEAGALDEREWDECQSLGSIVACDPERISEVVPQLRGHRPSGVTTFSEGMVPLTSELADALGLPFHTRETTAFLTDKRAQRRRLAEVDVDAVWSVAVTSRAEALAALESRPGPVVIKPVRSQSSRDTHLIEDGALPAELAPSEQRPFVIEEYLRGRDEGEFGDYLSVEELVVDGEVVTLGVTGKLPLLPPFREQGQFFPSHLPAAEQDEAARLAADAARALGIRQGLVHTEIKLTADGPRIIEVNGRVGGFMTELYGRASGQDWLALGIGVACGRHVEAEPAADAGSVTFQYLNQQPPPGGVLRQVEGADLVRRDPGIVGYESRVPVGKELPPQIGTLGLDILRGSGSDHETMLKTIDRCLEHLRFVFEEPDGAQRVWQATRSGLCAVA